jgi:hypothetical protein
MNLLKENLLVIAWFIKTKRLPAGAFRLCMDHRMNLLYKLLENINKEDLALLQHLLS